MSGINVVGSGFIHAAGSKGISGIEFGTLHFYQITPERRFAHDFRTAGQICQHRCPRQSQTVGRGVDAPEVFTNLHTQLELVSGGKHEITAERHSLFTDIYEGVKDIFTRRKVTLFMIFPVVDQLLFGYSPHNTAILNDQCCIVDLTLKNQRQPHYGYTGIFYCGFRNFYGGISGGLQQSLLKKQIADGVAGNAHFGENHRRCTIAGGLFIKSDYFIGISFHIS